MNDDLVAVIAVYNEEELLPACLASLADRADRVVLADGRFQHYPGTGGPSSDRTLEVAERVCAEKNLELDVIPSPADGWRTEHGKRTALVQHPRFQLGEMVLVIDADERLDCPKPGKLREAYGDYRVDVGGVDGTPGHHQAVRLFAWREGLEYRFHFGLFTAAGTPVLHSHHPLPPSVARIEHVHAKRPPERQAADKEWEAWLVPFEQSLGAYGPVHPGR